MADFTMPSLGADMTEGTLLEWLVKPGDTVHRGDVVAVVDTAKAAVEVESFADGVVTQLLVEPGTTVPVGQVLATLGDGGKPRRRGHRPAAQPAAALPPAQPASQPASQPAAQPAAQPTPAPTPPPPPAREPVVAPQTAATERAPVTERVMATPRARRLAEQLGVDLASLAGVPHKPVRAEDVRAAAGQEPRAPRQPEAVPATSAVGSRAETMRSTIAAVMTRSNRDIPHYHLATTVDLGRASAWLREHNRAVPVADRLVAAALLLRATALAARANPAVNGFWVDDAFRPASRVHLGIAISLRGGGLVAPALHDADELSVAELMPRMRDLVTRARGGRLRSSELTDATITVTNLGDQGVELVHGLIYPPQVALVGFGRIVDRPWAVDGLIGVRPLATLTLAGDHRATDGFTGARFLADIDQRLQHPEEL